MADDGSGAFTPGGGDTGGGGAGGSWDSGDGGDSSAQAGDGGAFGAPGSSTDAPGSAASNGSGNAGGGDGGDSGGSGNSSGGQSGPQAASVTRISIAIGDSLPQGDGNSAYLTLGSYSIAQDDSGNATGVTLPNTQGIGSQVFQACRNWFSSPVSYNFSFGPA